MAIMDWIQTEKWRDYYPSTTWRKKKNQRMYIQVWKTGLPLKEMKRRGHIGTYIFRSISNRKKYFKTKAEAFAYARNYMRRN